ncbi:MAG: glycoside hydrolase family 92 protein [Bacteroidetes bacterium]|nr:MAG: glycoside hydrolase family 92 protein [Bacteroidota bacterium]
MKKHLFFILLLSFLFSGYSQSNIKKLTVDYVDPLIGTSTSRWMLFPGASLPFGMVKLSPDNQVLGWKAGYEYNIENIAGFSHIHSWVMGGLLCMPTTGDLKIIPGTEDDPDYGYRSRFSHENETTTPGYYSVFLDDYKIKAELTTTTRAGFQRYTFPASNSSRILFDLKTPTEYGYVVDWAYVKKISNTEIEGYSKQKTFDTFSELNNEYIIHFVIKFDKPFDSFGGWVVDREDRPGDSPLPYNTELTYKDDVIKEDTYEIYGRGDVGFFLNYSTSDNEIIQVQTAISLVSIEQARLNLETEMSKFNWDFDAVKNDARQIWNSLLSKIEIEGGTELDKKKFYTNFYRSYSARTIWSDVNGKYVDMCEQIVQLDDKDSPIYGCDAFWNTFWNLNQLWALITPEITNSWVKSLIEINDRGGWLPKGPATIEYSSIMVASHEVALINSAYQKGIRNYDVNKAYEAIKHVQMEPGKAHECGGLVGNRQLKPYMELGYVPHGPGTEKYFFGTNEEGPVSNTLEYAFDDWNVSQMAKALGKTDDYEYFKKRAYNYKNVFDSEKGFMRAKNTDGTWVETSSSFGDEIRADAWKGTGFIEGNSWQYTWFVPHDVQGLIQLLGKDEFNERLTIGFEKSKETNFNASGDLFHDYPINHGNQPNMQAAYLFNYSGQPWKTQKWAREIMDIYYGSTPVDGWPGDEDQGQMGAWYVMSAMGLFVMNGGGNTEPFYEISGPLFEKISIHLDNKYYPGGKFVIEAKNVSAKNRYIQSAKLDGKPLNKPWFFHSELVDGGKLVLKMGSKPNKRWGSSPEDAPPSMSNPIKK